MTIARGLRFGAWARICETFAAILSPTLFSNLGKYYYNGDNSIVLYSANAQVRMLKWQS